MHRITGDGFLIDSGKRIFADEDLPARYATQVTHMWANAIQEEIASVVEGAGGTLHTDAEAISAMTQLKDSINALIAIETSARTIADAAIIATAATLKTMAKPTFDVRVGCGSNAVADSHVVFFGGTVADSTATYAITLPAYDKVLAKNMAYVRGANGCGVPNLAIVSGTKLHVFALQFASGADDVGFDTSITAANLRSMSTPAIAFRRISFVWVDSVDGGNAGHCLPFDHSPSGYYKFRTPVQYAKTTDTGSSYAYAYWNKAAVALPDSVPWGIRIVASVLPPATVDCKIGISAGADGWDYDEMQGTVRSWDAERLGGSQIHGRAHINLPCPDLSTNNNIVVVYANINSAVPVVWALEGFYDQRAL